MRRIVPIIFASMLVPTLAFAQSQGVIEDKKQITVQSKKTDERSQIDLTNQRETGKTTILDAPGRAGVSMQCYVTDGGHRVRIDAQNNNNSSRKCNSYCFYRTSQGYSGTHTCSGTLGGGYNGEFCSAYESGWTYTITDAGAFDCQQ